MKTAPASISEVLQADKEFSDMSKHIGIKKAYMEFMSDEGVLLRPDFLPISGASAVDYLSMPTASGPTTLRKSLRPMQISVKRIVYSPLRS